MTDDELVEIAIQGHASTRDAIRYAIKQEREACAKVCEELVAHIDANTDRNAWLASVACAAAIHARHEPVSLNNGRLTQYPDGSIGIGTPPQRQWQGLTDEMALNAELLAALKDAAGCVQSNYLPDRMGHDWDDVIAKAEARGNK